MASKKPNGGPAEDQTVQPVDATPRNENGKANAAEPVDDTPPVDDVDQVPVIAPPPRGRQTAAPLCPYHKKHCVAKRSDAYFTRYYCPVKGCSFMVKQPRPQLANRLYAEQAEDFSAR